MYRHAQYESRFVDCGYHEQAPFFREAVSLIDQCTKLLKDDRITLRNKIKQYLRSIRENRPIENEEDLEQFNQLMQIFVQANKKKSLGKIQKGDRAMDWLQIKLRKFIDNTKKERHKRELQNFKRGKCNDSKKNPDTTKSKETRIMSRFEPENRHILGASRESNHHPPQMNSHYQPPVSSLSRSRQKPGIETSRKKLNHPSYAQYSYHKNFSFLQRNKVHPQPRKNRFKPEIFPSNKSLSKSRNIDKKITNLNKSLDQLSKFNHSLNVSRGKVNNFNLHTSKPLQSKKNYEKKTNISESTQRQINSLTKLFTQQLNGQPKKSQPVMSKKNHNIPFRIQELAPTPNPLGVSDRIKHENSFSQDLKNIQQKFESRPSFDDQIKHNTSQQSKPEIEVNHNIPTTYEDLFTPPDFLAQCRKFIETSHKKKEEEQIEPVADQHQNGQKLSFNNILQQSREKVRGKFTYLNQFGINEAISENASLEISNKKPESEVQFQFKSSSVHSVQQLLLQIFKNKPQRSLDAYQLGQIMSKCSTQTQKIFQTYCDVLNSQSNNQTVNLELNFVGMLKYFYTYGKIFKESDNHFSNFICSILDMNKNGYINLPEIQDFLDSMEDSEIEKETLEEIRTNLLSIFKRCCEIQGSGTLITRWSLFYLQLKEDKQLTTLNQLLSRFEFQIDAE